MHTNVCEPRTLLDPQESLSIPFARGEQRLGVGVCWRSMSMIFTANIPSDFTLCDEITNLFLQFLLLNGYHPIWTLKHGLSSLNQLNPK